MVQTSERVWGLGFRAQPQGLEFIVTSSGCMAQNARFRTKSLGFRVWGLGFRGLGFRIKDLGFRIYDLEFLGFRV